MDTSELEPTRDGDINTGDTGNSNPVGIENTSEPIADIGIGIKSEWEITLTDAATGEVKEQIPWHKNMILDVGLNFLLNNPSGPGYWLHDNGSQTPFRVIAVGTGNAAPASTDTGLQTQLMRKALTMNTCTAKNVTDPAAPYCIIGTTFTETEANGDLKEVGLCTALTGGTFFNRDLFRDGNGDPVTITKTSNDLLTVKCKITVKRLSEAPSSYNVTASDAAVHAVKGIVTNNGLSGFIDTSDLWSTARFVSGTSSADPAPLDTGIKAGSMLGSVNNPWNAAHTGPTGGFYREMPVVANPADCNQNILEFSPNMSAFHSRFTFSPALAKTSAKKLTLTFRVTLSRL